MGRGRNEEISEERQQTERERETHTQRETWLGD